LIARRRAALAAPGGRSARRALRSSAGSTPEMDRSKASAEPRADHELPRAGGGRAFASTRACRRLRRSRTSTTRSSRSCRATAFDREHARRRMLRALGEFEIGGSRRCSAFHQALLEHTLLRRGAMPRAVVESGGAGPSAARRWLSRSRRSGAGERSDPRAPAAPGARRPRATRVEPLVPEPPARRAARAAGAERAAARRPRAPRTRRDADAGHRGSRSRSRGHQSTPSPGGDLRRLRR
jgi:hypothetical protein